ncbi:hypothetical protein FFLO_03771 [Filobasidium floriforme]|uniref:Protein CPL1-like domain-containing protein n=1 Tax=Filobasidium floriforme TaxID=5210 RepID=A0A8K0NPW4_9TREE|nr:hypothetical protein FFLO_03771 [Filobasidium floriforme]
MAPLAFALPSAAPSIEHPDVDLVSSAHNLTERTYYTTTWTSLRCDRISGYYGFGLFAVKYDFGCLCYNDVDTFCRVNGLSYTMNSWIKGQFNYQSYNKYPTGSQPICDDKGGYTCPFGKNSDGSCAQHAASCGDGQCLQSDGTCCPRGTTKINGLCCATTCRGTSNGQCYGSGSCTNGKVLSNELCCQSGWTGYDTVCCPSGQILNSAKTGCIAQCTTQQKFVPESGTCQPKCGSGFTWSSSSTNPDGLCCTGGRVCNTKVCCLTTEIESEGHCCPKGYTWRNNACQAPSGVPTAPKSRRRALNNNKRHLSLAEKSRLRIDEKLCPKTMSACPIGKESSSYECLDTFTDISSCGGCASVGEGQDCTAIKGAKWMGCEQGSCVVYSCRPGFKLVGGKECVKA